MRPVPIVMSVAAVMVAAVIWILIPHGPPADVGARPVGPAVPFHQVGVIEGFYGQPWSHAERIAMLRFMGRVGMNVYYYAPKNDPYHRDRWREAYPAADLERLEELSAVARAENIDFYFSISPGLSMVYSDAADRAALEDKISTVLGLGIRHVALMLDDVPQTLVHAADAARFSTLADAHADLINALHTFLEDQDTELVVTPTTYTNAWGDREYLRRLGQLVPSSIPFFWTGPDVASSEITAEAARTWGEIMGRPPLIWDNFPVNDYARWRVFLGPVRGRSADLASAAVGIVSNPMNQPWASMLPVATVAAYGRNPDTYEPRAAIRDAALDLFGRDVTEHLAPFFDVYRSYGWDAHLFEPLFAPGTPIDERAVEAAIEALERALEMLSGPPFDTRDTVRSLVAELSAIVAGTRQQLTRLRNDERYESQGAQLVYRADLDRVEAITPARPITVDGVLDEWDGPAWRRFHGTAGPDPVALGAIARQGNRLVLGLRVRDADVRARPGAEAGEGDHVAVILDYDPTGRTHIGYEDPVIVLTPPPGAQATVWSLDYHGFMAKNVAARRNLRFTEFVLTSLDRPLSQPLQTLANGLEYRSRSTSEGYQLELSLAVDRPTGLRMTVMVANLEGGRFRYRSLPQRNYPANPMTYVEVN